MAKIIGKDTYLLAQKKDHSVNSIFLIYVFIISVLTYWVYIFSFHLKQPETNIFGVVLLLIYAVMNKPINEEIRKKWDYTYGLLGEESIQKILMTLPDSYLVASNVVLPGKQANIDFVVVGPTGVFTIEVKSHKGRISYDGQQLLHYGKRFEKDFLWQTKSEARDLAKYLNQVNCEAPVEPILVFSNRFASVRFGNKPIDGITIIGSRWLIKTIQDRSVTSELSMEKISALQTILTQISK